MIKDDLLLFDMQTVRFSIFSDDSVLGAGEMITHYGTEPSKACMLRIRGSKINERAFLQYEAKEIENPGVSWNGVSVLNIPPKGRIHGYWLANDIRGNGKFSFGDVSLQINE